MAKTVILIDDDQDDLDMIKETIVAMDPSMLCITFNYPVEAIRVITNELIIMPDFVITDINMPGMTGYEVVKALRSSPDFNDTNITVLSTTMRNDVVQSLKNIGANFCFQKPVSITEYGTLLAPIFQHHRLTN